MSESQELKKLVQDLLAKTVGSRTFSEEGKKYHVDKSSIALGATIETRELSYPLVIEAAEGAHLEDIDGNRYLDILQGLGANLFGHNPEFVREAIKAKLDTGFSIGSQSPLVNELARLVTEITGMSKVCFSNTGTEAIMTAIRVARAKTKRNKIVIFSDSYHGHVDWVIMRPALLEFARRKFAEKFSRGPLSFLGKFLDKLLVKGAAPASAGVPNSIAKDVVVLPYGHESSLRAIRRMGEKIAAVLVEPVQSRRPELQPREFLHELRETTQSQGSALIFDEMVSGFRVTPSGAQGYFGVEADLVTYSKIAGGGLPLSIIAGRGDWLDCLLPSAKGRDKSVFFAGTFCKHPLSIVAAHATLKKIYEEGPALQEQLTAVTAQMVAELNTELDSAALPVRFTHFGSFFSISMSESKLQPEQINFLSYYLRAHDIHLRGGDRGGFLTTAHQAEDIQKIKTTFVAGLKEICHAPRPNSS